MATPTYDLLTRLSAPLAQWLLARRRRGVPLKNRRCGFFALSEPGKSPEKPPFSAQNRPIWLHCASAGEVVAAQPLIDALKTANRPVFITIWSPNGARKLIQLYGETLPWAWLPWDTPGAMRKLVMAFQPAELWIVETEIWPNLIHATKTEGVPVRYVNGRLTEKSLKAPGWLRRAWREALSQVDQVLARGKADAARFAELGVPAERIEVAGNLKWLAAAQLIEHSPDLLRNGPYLLFASAYDDELDKLMPLLADQRGEMPWVIVPRRPDRDARHVRTTAEELGLSVTMIETDTQAAEARADILVETRFGNLTRWMAGAEAVVMGGSFGPHGGHNFLEAAALGKPIITGPDMRDFEEETALFLKEGALIQCNSLKCVLDSINQHTLRLGQRACQQLLQQTQIISRHYEQALKIALPVQGQGSP